VFWLASTIEVRSRLWLGGLISTRRDRELIRAALWGTPQCVCEGMLLCTDALLSYAKQADYNEKRD
jgi:hypothetical protein